MQVLGIDAGGSRTRVVVGERATLLAGGPYRSEHFAAANFRQIGVSGVANLLDEIGARCDIGDPAYTLVVAGFAGAGTPESCAQIRGVLVEKGYAEARVHVTSDAGLLLWALDNDGIALIAGTGSICFGRRAGATVGAATTNDAKVGEARTGEAIVDEVTEVRAGGYGYRIASEAGGYRLGIQAIDAALKIADGRRQEPTLLYEVVRAHFDLHDLQQIVPHLYPAEGNESDVRERVAGLAPAVFAAAAAGDDEASRLLRETVDDLADHVRAVATRLGSERGATVALHGGLFAGPHAEGLLIAPLREHEQLADWKLCFESLGVREGDKDPLIEALRFACR